MTPIDIERLYERVPRAQWRAVYRRVRKDPALYSYDNGLRHGRLVMAALYALGFRESPRALHQSTRYGGFWPGMVP